MNKNVKYYNPDNRLDNKAIINLAVISTLRCRCYQGKFKSNNQLYYHF